MKRIIALTIIIFSITIAAMAQTTPIKIDNSGMGTKFYQNNLRLNFQQLEQAVKTNPEALEKVKAAKGNNILASIISIPGGFLIGYPLGQAMAGGEPNWLMAGIGAGLILVSIPISSAAKNRAIEGVEIYNSSLKDVSYKNDTYKPDFSFGTTSEGVGVRMRF